MATTASEMSTQLNNILKDFGAPDILQNPKALKTAVTALAEPSARKSRRELLGALFDASDNASQEDFPKLRNFAEFLSKCCNLSLRANLGLTEEQESVLENLWSNVDADWLGLAKLPEWQQNKTVAQPTTATPAPAKKGTVSRAGIIYRRNVQLEEDINALKLELEKAQKEAEMLRSIGLALGLKGLFTLKDLEAVLGSPLPSVQELKKALELKQVLEQKGLPVDSGQHLGKRVDELLNSDAQLKEAYNKLKDLNETLIAERQAAAKAEELKKALSDRGLPVDSGQTLGKRVDELLNSDAELAKLRDELQKTKEALKASLRAQNQSEELKKALSDRGLPVDSGQNLGKRVDELLNSDAELAKLRDELNKLQAALKIAQEEKNKAEQERAKFEAELLQVRKELQQAKDALQQALRELAAEKQARKDEVLQLQKQLQQAHDDLMSERKARKDEVLQLQKQLQQVHDDLAKEQKARKDEMTSLQKLIQQLRAELDAEKQGKKKAETEVQNLQHALAKEKQLVTKLQADLITANQALANAKISQPLGQGQPMLHQFAQVQGQLVDMEEFGKFCILQKQRGAI